MSKELTDFLLTPYGSPKRYRILYLLKENAKMGLTEIKTKFEEQFGKIAISEVYRHLKKLSENGLIKQQGKAYVITRRGVSAVDYAELLYKTEPDIPTLKLMFPEK